MVASAFGTTPSAAAKRLQKIPVAFCRCKKLCGRGLHGGFCYGFERSNPDCLSAAVLISAVPDSVTKLERLLGLEP